MVREIYEGGGNYVPLPAGKYPMEVLDIKDAEKSEQFKDSGPSIKIRLQVLDEAKKKVKVDIKDDEQQSYSLTIFAGLTLGSPVKRTKLYNFVSDALGDEGSAKFTTWITNKGPFNPDWLQTFEVSVRIKHELRADGSPKAVAHVIEPLDETGTDNWQKMSHEMKKRAPDLFAELFSGKKADTRTPVAAGAAKADDDIPF